MSSPDQQTDSSPPGIDHDKNRRGLVVAPLEGSAPGAAVPPDLFVTTCGAGIPVYVLGAIHMDHRYLRPHLDRLGEFCEVVYLDHRGTGSSPRPADWGTVTHESWIDDVERLRVRLGHGRIVLFGHSYGGFLAQEYALEYPQHLAGLVLACTAPAFDYPDVVFANAQARGTPHQLQVLAEAFAAPVATDEHLEAVFRSILSLYFRSFDPAVHEPMLADVRCSAAAFNRAYFHCVQGFNTVERLAELTTDVLLLCGRHDWITPPEQTERIARRLPDARVVRFEESGHFPFIEEAAAFRRAVAGWIAQVDRSRIPGRTT
jgi:proline iminopeptidase